MITQIRPTTPFYTPAYRQAVVATLTSIRPSRKKVTLSAELGRAIAKQFKGEVPPAPVLTAYLTRIGRGNLSDCLVVENVPQKQLVRKPLAELIDSLTAEIEQQKGQLSETALTPKKARQQATSLRDQERTRLRYQIELEGNPQAYRNVEGAGLKQNVSLDEVAVAEAHERGLIKRLSVSKHGFSLEYYSAPDALKVILQLHDRL